MNIIDVIRSYNFVPSGEAVRAIEVAVVTAMVWSASQQDFSQLANWRVWAGAIALAGVQAGIGAIKGMLPSPIKPPA